MLFFCECTYNSWTRTCINICLIIFLKCLSILFQWKSSIICSKLIVEKSKLLGLRYNSKLDLHYGNQLSCAKLDVSRLFYNCLKSYRLFDLRSLTKGSYIDKFVSVVKYDFFIVRKNSNWKIKIQSYSVFNQVGCCWIIQFTALGKIIIWQQWNYL